MTATQELPLFPLNTVLFPGGVLPLRIFETRYLDLISACLRNDSGFGVVTIQEGGEAGGPTTHIHPVGTLARIVDFDQGRHAQPMGCFHQCLRIGIADAGHLEALSSRATQRIVVAVAQGHRVDAHQRAELQPEDLADAQVVVV